MANRKLTPRQLQAMESRQKIFDAAVDLFDRKGYEKVTIAEICQRAGFTPGAFYTYFKSKDQIFMQRYFELDNHYEQVALEFAKEEDALRKLQVVFGEALRYIDNLGSKVTRVVYHAELSPAKKKSYIDSEKRSIYPISKAFLEEGQANGIIRRDIDAAELATQIINCVRGLVYEWCLKKGSFDLRKRGEILFEIMLKGIRI